MQQVPNTGPRATYVDMFPRRAKAKRSAMDPKCPEYLFRTYTDYSFGHNSAKLFMSAARQGGRARCGKDFGFSSKQIASLLRDALIGNAAPNNPWIFTTSSMAYACQHAIAKRARNLMRTYIVCVKTDTARTLDGNPVKFMPAQEAMAEHNMKLPNARWTRLKRDYSDVYVSLDSIVPGPGSTVVSYDTLVEQGLYDLYPAWRLIVSRSNPGLETPITNLRKFSFRREQDITDGEITLAAKSANSFLPVDNIQDSNMPAHLFAWFLALKNQQRAGINLRNWISEYASDTAQDGISHPVRGVAIPELDQYNKLHAILQEMVIGREYVQKMVPILFQARIDSQKSEFKEFVAAQKPDEKNAASTEKKKLQAQEPQTTDA